MRLRKCTHWYCNSFLFQMNGKFPLLEMYQMREMWSSAYLRGQFFVGYRTTSHFEGLHSLIGKFVHSKYNLNDFMHHLHRCVSYIRFTELKDILSLALWSIYATNFQELERSASIVYTRDMLEQVKSIIEKLRISMLMWWKRPFPTLFTRCIGTWRLLRSGKY